MAMTNHHLTRRVFLGASLGALLSPAGAAAAAKLPQALPAPVPEGFRAMLVPVDGMAMHTLISATHPPGAPPLVLVHGLALSGRYMVPTAQAMLGNFHVHVPDFPGFGDSGKPSRPLDVPGLADWLVRWMDAVKLDRAAMLGNSFGCQIIADVAARYPDRVTSGILQGPTTPPDERTWLWQYVRWQQNAPFNPPMMGKIAGDDYAKCGLVRALLTFEFSLRDRIEAKLPHVQAPMLVVRGQLDPICGQDWAETVTHLLPDGRLAVIPAVAHTLVFTHPRSLADLSRKFLLESR